jgi:hypothetical protein
MEKIIKIEICNDDKDNEIIFYSSKGLNKYEIIGILTTYLNKLNKKN